MRWIWHGRSSIGISNIRSRRCCFTALPACLFSETSRNVCLPGVNVQRHWGTTCWVRRTQTPPAYKPTWVFQLGLTSPLREPQSRLAASHPWQHSTCNAKWLRPLCSWSSWCSAWPKYRMSTGSPTTARLGILHKCLHTNQTQWNIAIKLTTKRHYTYRIHLYKNFSCRDRFFSIASAFFFDIGHLPTD